VTDSDPQTLTDIQLLYKLLKQLPDEQQECILLFEISGFSLKEIAIIQSVSEGAVKQRLRRGREKLGELMNYVSPENQQG
jgi:RNA polymerase sigma-70 factor (ECF subfamily)